MLRHRIFFNLSNHIQRTQIRSKLTDVSEIEKLAEQNLMVEVIEEDTSAREAEIEKMRNKSGLYQAQRSMVHDEQPYPEPVIWTHHTLAYARKTYGRYGKSSGVNPSVCWPTESELISRREWERIAYPLTIAQMVQNVHREKREKEERKQARQEDIVKKMASLEKMKQDLFNRIAKKEADMLAIKEKKAKLVEEVRRHFGYTVHPNDEKFKEMLEQKEKEQKKVAKEARKRAKEEQMMSKLLNKNDPKAKAGDGKVAANKAQDDDI